MIRNQRGIITVDFIFAMVLVLGLCGLMFAMTFTLSIASLTQYVTFAAARNYFPAHINKDQQEKRAQLKFKELLNHATFKPLFKNGWYEVDADPNVGDQTKIITGFEAATQGVNQFWGVGTTFIARVLDFNIPFFGSSNPDGDGAGFTSYIGSYLGREPTTEECKEFIAARWENIRSLPASGGAAYSTGGQGKYFPMTDDGC